MDCILADWQPSWDHQVRANMLEQHMHPNKPARYCCMQSSDLVDAAGRPSVLLKELGLEFGI